MSQVLFLPFCLLQSSKSIVLVCYLNCWKVNKAFYILYERQWIQNINSVDQHCPNIVTEFSKKMISSNCFYKNVLVQEFGFYRKRCCKWNEYIFSHLCKVERTHRRKLRICCIDRCLQSHSCRPAWCRRSDRLSRWCRKQLTSSLDHRPHRGWEILMRQNSKSFCCVSGSTSRLLYWKKNHLNYM